MLPKGREEKVHETTDEVGLSPCVYNNIITQSLTGIEN